MADPILRSEEEAKLTYYTLLRDLTFNSKEKINQLSQISEKNSKYARIIVDVVYKHIKEAIPGQKLPTLYLIDSIIKNVGGIYKQLFEEHIVEMFLLVFESGTGDIKTSLYKLRNTWRKVIDERELARLDKYVKERDANWPIQSTNENKCIYINPTYTNGTNPLIPKEREIEDTPQAKDPLPEPPSAVISSHREELREQHPDILANLDHSMPKNKAILIRLRNYKIEKIDTNTVREAPPPVEPMDTSKQRIGSPRPHNEEDITSPTLVNNPKKVKVNFDTIRNIIQSVNIPVPEPPHVPPPVQEPNYTRPRLQIPPPHFHPMQPCPERPVESSFRGPMPQLPPPMRGPLRGPPPHRGPMHHRGHSAPRAPPAPRGHMPSRGVPQGMKGHIPLRGPPEPRGHSPRRSKRSPRADQMHGPPYPPRPMNPRPPIFDPTPIRHIAPHTRLPPPLSLPPSQQHPHFHREDLKSEEHSIEGQQYKVVEQEIPRLEMKMDCLVERINVVVQFVHKGEQCGTCGIRFDKTSPSYRTHLDWHYQVNRYKPKSTYWYLPDGDWVKYVPDQKELLSDFSEQEERDKWVRDKKEEEEIANVVLRDSELVQRCRICRDMLEMYFDQDNDEWCCKDAVRLGNKVVVHKECAKDYAGPLFDTTPTPVTEKPLGKEGLISPEILFRDDTPTRKINEFPLTSEDLNLLINIFPNASKETQGILDPSQCPNYPVVNPDKIELDDSDSEDTNKMSFEPMNDNTGIPIDNNDNEMKSPSVDSDKSMETSVCEEQLDLPEEIQTEEDQDSVFNVNDTVSVIQVFPSTGTQPASESGESDIQTDTIQNPTSIESSQFLKS